MAIITVSREYGSDSCTLGRSLAEKLGYSFVDRETILYMVKKHGTLHGKLKRKASQFEQTALENFDISCIGLIAIEEKAIFEHALADNTVIVGRGGNCLLKNLPYALHVRLVAPLQIRIANILKRIDISPDQARNLVIQSDLDRSGYIRTTYNQDWADPLNYDLVIDTAKISDEEIIEQIDKLIADKSRLATEEEKLKLAKNTLAANVKAAVISSLEINILNLTVHHDGKSIIMNGIVKHQDEKKHAEIIARTTAKGEPFINKLRECV